jgi:hypothetical protein
VTIFRSSVEAWRPLITQYANGKSINFLLRWLDVESGGYPCDYTYLGESGIGQLDASNMASVGTNVDEQHPTPPCPPVSLGCQKAPGPCSAGTHSVTYNDLTDDQRMLQLVPWLAYVDLCINRAQTDLAQYGYNWPTNTTSFWSMVKMGHVAPARIPVMLAQGLVCNGGVPPADWDSLIACGPFPNTPQNWIDNATNVGSYATDAKLFGTIIGGIIPTWFAIALGVGGLFAAVFLVRKAKKRYPKVWTKLHLPEKVPVLWN